MYRYLTVFSFNNIIYLLLIIYKCILFELLLVKILIFELKECIKSLMLSNWTLPILNNLTF